MPKHVDMLFIGFGANDAAYGLEPEDFHQGISKQTYANSLRDIIAEARKYTDNVVLVTPPPLKQFEHRNKEQTEEYAQISVQVAKEASVKLMDIRTHPERLHDIWADGLHMNAEGNALYADCASELIGEVPFWRDHWSVWPRE